MRPQVRALETILLAREKVRPPPLLAPPGRGEAAPWAAGARLRCAGTAGGRRRGCADAQLLRRGGGRGQVVQEREQQSVSRPGSMGAGSPLDRPAPPGARRGTLGQDAGRYESPW